MKMSTALFALGSVIAAGDAWAQDVPLTAEEFQSLMVGKSMRWKLDDGAIGEMELSPGGKATISGFYNDVGKWRASGHDGYCTTWNKRPMNESCIRVIKRNGTLTLLRPDGGYRGAQISSQ